jgi:hypothetical protein
MNMDVLERAARLYQEAGQIMELVRLREILRPAGEITYTGSYFLDTMVFPDIDLYIPPVPIEQIFDFGSQFARSELVSQVVFEKSSDPSLPGGLYLKPRIYYGNWERPWKIDIWSLAETVIAEKMEPMQRFKARITPDLRATIIRYKMSIITSAHRTPVYSGYFIYRAVLDEGLTDPAQITNYLLQNGIDLDDSGPG